MMVLRNNIVVIEHDRRLELPSAPLDIKYDNRSTEQYHIL